MRLALIQTTDTICPQCGEDWQGAAAARPEYCRRCGSPFLGFGFDPLRARVYSKGGVRVNRRAKLIVRFGVLAIGLIGFITGLSLIYDGWISSGGLDAIQLWASRVSGPLLIAQGLLYSWLPFRRPDGGVILPFATGRRVT